MIIFQCESVHIGGIVSRIQRDSKWPIDDPRRRMAWRDAVATCYVSGQRALRPQRPAGWRWSPPPVVPPPLSSHPILDPPPTCMPPPQAQWQGFMANPSLLIDYSTPGRAAARLAGQRQRPTSAGILNGSQESWNWICLCPLKHAKVGSIKRVQFSQSRARHAGPADDAPASGGGGHSASVQTMFNILFMLYLVNINPWLVLTQA